MGILWAHTGAIGYIVLSPFLVWKLLIKYAEYPSLYTLGNLYLSCCMRSVIFARM